MTINRFKFFLYSEKLLQALFTTSFDMRPVNKEKVVNAGFLIAF